MTRVDAAIIGSLGYSVVLSILYARLSDKYNRLRRSYEQLKPKEKKTTWPTTGPMKQSSTPSRTTKSAS